ncbi:hypothetical protein [Actinokineospora sp. NPDC004072]
MHRTAIAAAAAAALLLAGCSSTDGSPAGGDAGQPTSAAAPEQTTTAAEAAAPVSPFTADGFKTALAALAEQVGEDPITGALEIVLSESHLAVQAIDPAKPEEVNQFTFSNGATGQPAPVDVSGSDPGALEANRFSTADLDPAAVAKVIAEAPAASKVADAAVTTVIIKRLLPATDDIRIIVNVQGPRGTKQIRADVTGKVVEIV